jgi:cysteinyl-tRNA synthetase
VPASIPVIQKTNSASAKVPLIYNSLTRQKQSLPLPESGKPIGMYVCGVTVYDRCHIGHARTYLAFDVVLRYLQFLGHKVCYVRNITDIDDKIIQRAQEQGVTTTALTERYIAAMHADFRALGLLEPQIEPRATEHIQQMQALITILLEKGIAYQADNGDVYYQVAKFAPYGQLSQRSIAQALEGDAAEAYVSRLAHNHAKQHELDFVLWKAAKPGEPAWPSPWGAGRPGWHIECSAMAMQHLGEQFALHGGGVDLTFPHHENECAQSEAATGKPFVSIWMHVGFLQVNTTKMSKSLQNFVTIHEALAAHHPEVLRWFMLSTQYRHSIEYTPENLQQAAHGLERLYLALRHVALDRAWDAAESEQAMAHYASHPLTASYLTAFCEAMDDDFNTPAAISVLFEIGKELNKHKAEPNSAAESVSILAGLLKYLASSLGCLQLAPEQFLQKLQSQQLDIVKIEALVAARQHARLRGNWQEADAIRQQLLALNIVLEDGASGTSWRAL